MRRTVTVGAIEAQTSYLHGLEVRQVQPPIAVYREPVMPDPSSEHLPEKREKMCEHEPERCAQAPKSHSSIHPPPIPK
jgi:hypothetical protein